MAMSYPLHSRKTYCKVVLAIYAVAALLTTLVVAASLREVDSDTDHLARERGEVLFRLIETTRDWSARHGGVYVPVTEASPPNEYLKHPRRDITDQNGRALTLVNPAYMTRQIAEIAAREDGVKFHLTSLKPIRPENRPDDWETESLQFFESGALADRLSFLPGNGADGGPAHRYMAALMVKTPCLKCHEVQGYKVGDIRGGLSITMPADKLLAVAEVRKGQIIALGVVLGTLLAALGHWIARMAHGHLKTINQINASLEATVAERTREVAALYDHEHYLRELLVTVSEINESLITSYSMGSIIESSIEKLRNNPHYRLIVLGQFDGRTIHIRHTLGDRYRLVGAPAYTLDELRAVPALASMADAAENGHRAVRTVDFNAEGAGNRSDDYRITASLSVPMVDHDERPHFKVLTFCTDRPEGFDNEEVGILAAITADLAMALSAYKQRQLSENLYRENIKNYEETILAFVDMIEHRDAYTAGHTLRVARYSRLIAEAMKLDEKSIARLEKAAILHDIGKIATPDTILLKPGKLTPLEYQLIQMHVAAGYRMLSKVKMYAELAEIMVYHHERHDGKGYPKGVAGDAIPLEARIMIVADAFDAMTTNRIYRGRLSVEEAIVEIKQHTGGQFNPEVAAVAVSALAGEVIDEATQLPHSDLERQRFSYFFSDTLTGLHNTTYLQLVLNREKHYYCANILELKNFSQFNKAHGWKRGNEILIDVAHQLRQLFPEAMLFRYQGDDFLILNQCHTVFPSPSINLSAQDAQGLITLRHDHLDLREDRDRLRLLELLEMSM